jgi:hypothetical protein
MSVLTYKQHFFLFQSQISIVWRFWLPAHCTSFRSRAFYLDLFSLSSLTYTTLSVECTLNLQIHQSTLLCTAPIILLTCHLLHKPCSQSINRDIQFSTSNKLNIHSLQTSLLNSVRILFIWLLIIIMCSVVSIYHGMRFSL